MAKGKKKKSGKKSKKKVLTAKKKSAKKSSKKSAKKSAKKAKKAAKKSARKSKAAAPKRSARKASAKKSAAKKKAAPAAKAAAPKPAAPSLPRPSPRHRWLRRPRLPRPPPQRHRVGQPPVPPHQVPRRHGDTVRQARRLQAETRTNSAPGLSQVTVQGRSARRCGLFARMMPLEPARKSDHGRVECRVELRASDSTAGKSGSCRDRWPARSQPQKSDRRRWNRSKLLSKCNIRRQHFVEWL